MTEAQPKKEIAYFNNSTRKIIPGYHPLYHALSMTHKDADKDGYVRHLENINGQLREIKINLKGQFKLDHANRGGKRLWERIYTEEEMVEKMKASGVTMEKGGINAKKNEIKKTQEGSKEEEAKEEGVLAGSSNLEGQEESGDSTNSIRSSLGI